MVIHLDQAVWIVKFKENVWSFRAPYIHGMKLSVLDVDEKNFRSE